MISQKVRKNILAAKLAGILEYKNDNEFWWELVEGVKHTIEFVDETGSELIVRNYWDDNFHLHSYAEYKNDLLHGLQCNYYITGKVCWSTFWRNGKKHGSSVDYDEYGKILCKTNYIDGEITF